MITKLLISPLPEPVPRRPGVRLPILVAQDWAARRALRKKEERARRVELRMSLSGDDEVASSWGSWAERAERRIVDGSFRTLRPCCIEPGVRYRLTLELGEGEDLDAAAGRLLAVMRRHAANCHCELNAEIRQISTGKIWQ